jgi:hypothetical protein
MQKQEDERQMLNTDPREQAYYRHTNTRERCRREKQRMGIGPVLVVLTILIIGVVFGDWSRFVRLPPCQRIPSSLLDTLD